MTETKEQRLAREIYEKVGGMGNVAKLIYCMTRVRMTIRDDSKVDMDGLKAVDGVMGVVHCRTRDCQQGCEYHGCRGWC